MADLSGKGRRTADDLRADVAQLKKDIKYLKSSQSIVGNAGIEGKKGIRVTDANAKLLAAIGQLPDGTIGLKTYRPNGSTLFESMGAGVFGLSYTAFRDSLGNSLIQDDGVANGLARPRIPLGAWTDYTALGTPAAPTSSATFVTVQVLYGYVHNPKVRFDLLVSSSAAGTTGNVQVTDPSGTVIGSALAVPANANTLVSLGPTSLPNWNSGNAFSSGGYYSLQAQRTAGTGTIGARGLGAWGCAYADAS